MDEIVTRGLKTGLALTAASMTTMVVASAFERRSPWAGLNAMATAAGIGGRRARDRFDAAVTPAGIGLLAGGLLLWGLGYAAALGATQRRSSLVTGALSGLGGYALDRWILPSWLLPNFRRTLGPVGTTGKYVALALASAATSR